ncbi:MAG: hypothetical protein CVT85_05495 [Alphaproteobacteria bacterium HGW-Alphaproteobacteria-7]|jgi:hypothetical protein|nr:MAG: hypothetical protein CVT85_05495 [Alphaproteobacteria bacterium HGW-Alphaproteobacteria-7]
MRSVQTTKQSSLLNIAAFGAILAFGGNVAIAQDAVQDGTEPAEQTADSGAQPDEAATARGGGAAGKASFKRDGRGQGAGHARGIEKSDIRRGHVQGRRAQGEPGDNFCPKVAPKDGPVAESDQASNARWCNLKTNQDASAPADATTRRGPPAQHGEGAGNRLRGDLDADGDGHADAAARAGGFKAGKSLADTVKVAAPADEPDTTQQGDPVPDIGITVKQPSAAAAKPGDPIPGIDITVKQGPGR